MQYDKATSELNPDKFDNAMKELFDREPFMGPLIGSRGRYATMTMHYNIDSDLVVKYEATEIRSCGDPSFRIPESVSIEIDCESRVRKSQIEKQISDYFFPERRSF